MNVNSSSSTHSGRNRRTTKPRNWVRLLCHQIPERCFKINNEPMQLCARCFGFYLGLIIGLCLPFIFIDIFEIRITTLLAILLLGVAPMALDGITQLFRLRSSNNNLRFVTGIIAGLVLGILFSWLVVHILILD
jgi:uncharacterized membrane protein